MDAKTRKKQKKKTTDEEYRDYIEIYYKKNEVEKPILLRGWLNGAVRHPDGSTYWEFKAKESSRDTLSHKMSEQRGSVRWISPRGTAVERFGLVAWAFLLGMAAYRALSNFFGF
jgi:hypothetical protein